jgi:hypothetical protein
MRMDRFFFFLLMPLLSLLGPAALAQAQAQADQRQQVTNSPLFWRVDWITEQYIQHMTRHYNLTKPQEDYTRELMNKRVKQFLNDHERDVRSLVAELYDYYAKREMPSPEIARELGTRAKPLLAAAREEIFDGNREWRKILNEEQQAKHDRDLQQMTQTFDTFEERIDRWSKGEVSPADFGARVNERPMTIRRNEDAWEFFVRNYIQMYNFDEGQRQTAYSILRELREEAARYREAHKAEFARLDAEDRALAASSPKDDPEELKRATEQTRLRTERRMELDRPISVDMFNQLRARLEQIPTADQREDRDRRMARLNALGRRPVPMTGTQPAATQPAATQPAAATSEQATLAAQPEGQQ